MGDTWLFVVFLMQLLLTINVAAQTTPTENRSKACAYNRYTGDKEVAVNSKYCNKVEAIRVTGPVDVDGFDSAGALFVGEHSCNVNVTRISNSLVMSGSITIRNAECVSMFNQVRHIISHDKLVDLALKPCKVRHLIPTTTESPIFPSERYLELSLYLFKITVHNLEDVFAYLWKTSACWIPFITAFVWYREHVLERQHCEGLHMRERGKFRVYMDVIRELLPHSPLAIEVSIKFMRFFDKTSIYYYLMTHTILEDLLETTDDANWCEVNALRKQLKEIGVPVLLEIDERNKKLAAAGLITAPFTLYSKVNNEQY